MAPIFLLSACGGGSPSQPVAASGASRPVSSAPGAPPASTDPGPGPEAGGVCELLSDVDIVELTALEVDTVEERSAGGIFENGCYWALAGGGAVQAEILLGVFAPGGREHYDTVYVPIAESNGDEPLEGVGDVGHIGSGGSSVTVVVGDTLVDLQWFPDDPGGVRVALIERVLANLVGD